jgi:3-oxoacyl-[acyl-carrier-protein] synthase II
MTERRVVITGIGPVTPIGVGAETFWTGLQNARSVVRRVTRFDPSPFRSQLAAEVDGFEPTAWMDPRRAKRLDRCSQVSSSRRRIPTGSAR